MHTGPLRLGFLFAVVGYGTKAGLAPMHSWLPDAHSQAPTPVSAVLSGALLNCALYSLSRFLPVVEPGGSGWAHQILVVFGLISIAIAAAFIVHESDIKRLLAFSSVEHIGVITLGLGVGAANAALFHTFSHSACKMLAFFCAGSLAFGYGSRDMDRMHGTLRAAPVAGAGFLLAVLALVGLPPFSIFASELWIAKVGIERGHALAVVVYVAAIGVVFISAVRRAVQMTWPKPDVEVRVRGANGIAWPLVVIPLAVVLVAGIWMPSRVGAALDRAAILTGAP
jgi:hydrogenase-4 component F